jgi:neutral ceramidase
MRQWARAFVVEDNGKHVAFVSMDGGMGSDLVNKRVVEALNVKLPGVYSYENVCISGTHTHSTPGGFHQYVMLEVPSFGFVPESMDAMVTGVTNAIVKAHQSLAPGTIKYTDTHGHGAEKLFGANINRSPTSYLLNPQAERDEYEDEGDTDKGMLMVRFDAADGTPLGQVNWFAVHGTSLNNTNTLVSGDNRGYASYLFERDMNGKDVLPGKGKFVAAFAATNLGDVSPNTNGAKCVDTGLPCDKVKSTCGGKEEKCVAFGPGLNAQGQSDMYESMKIIGRKQYVYAKNLYEIATTEVVGPVDSRHSFVTFGDLPVTLEDGTQTKTCKAALGNAFAAGTTDGCGMFDFTQGTTSPNPFWNTVGGLLSEPTKEQKACHHPKPILLNTNGMTFPYAWDAPVLPIQIFRIGQLVISSDLTVPPTLPIIS